MSDSAEVQTESAKAEGQQDNTEEQAKATTEGESLDPNKLLERLEALESSKERLETESKKWKERYKELETENEAARQKRLEEEGKYQELLEMEKKKHATLQEQIDKTKKTALQKELLTQIARYAPNAHDFEDVYKNMPYEMLDLDEEDMTFKNVQDAVNQVKENKPYLFATDKLPGSMSSRPDGKPKAKDLNTMKPEEKQRMLASLLG